MRLKVTGQAIESAKENARIEMVKYEVSEGTTVDVIDALTALRRTESDYCRAGCAREIVLASLRKAVGTGITAEELE